MPNRKAMSEKRRRAHHQARFDAAAPDERLEFWAACNALAAAARKRRRLKDAKEAVLALTSKIEKGEPS